MKSLHQTLAWVYIGLISIALVIGCIRYKFQSKSHYRGITWLLGIILIIEMVSNYMALQKTNNEWLINYYLSIEYCVLSFIFYKSICRKRLQKLLALLSLLSILFAFINLIFIQKNYFNSYSFIFYSLILIFCCLEYIRQSINEKDNPFQNDALFWFALGGLLFYIGNILVTGFIQEWLKISANLASNLYLINRLLNIVYYLFVAIGLYYDNKKIIINGN